MNNSEKQNEETQLTNSGANKTDNLRSTINALILVGSGAVIATLGPNVYNTIKNEYTSTMDLRARASELIGAEQILNELKKNPGATIEFNKKTNSWQIILPLKNNKGRDKKKVETILQEGNPTEDIRGIQPNRAPVPWDSFNQKGIVGNDELPTATIISNSKHTGIVTTEDSYSAFARTLATNVSTAMPDFATLKDRAGLKEGDELMLIQNKDEVWVYGKVQENDSSQKYRLRIAVLDTKSKTINASFLNKFHYLIEN